MSLDFKAFKSTVKGLFLFYYFWLSLPTLDIFSYALLQSIGIHLSGPHHGYENIFPYFKALGFLNS